MKNNINLNDLKDKNVLIDNIINKLKSEFIGIDEQIDSIMDSVRTWFLFPFLQERPLIVNLWGMSGCGKTALVRRIVQLLDVENDFVYFNFAKIDEMSAWEIESDIEEHVSNTKSNRIFVYDEFQYAATIDENGKEKPKKSALKPFWELLDNGLLHQKFSFYKAQSLYNIYKNIEKINSMHPIQLDASGSWINAKECLSSFTDIEVEFLKEYFVFDMEHRSSDPNSIAASPRPIEDGCSNYECVKVKECFIKSFYLDTLYNCLYKAGKAGERAEFMLSFIKKSIPEMQETIMNACKISSKGYDLNYSNSLIFVIGNLDEAYTMSFNVDPDMSPDQFHSLTKRLTVVNIKEALRKRFRNEQIARLGNIHVIYPSFSCNSFKKIIELEINKYTDKTFQETGYNITCDRSIKDLIYKEGVFPTHGTRPVFSTIQEIIKSKLPLVVKNCVNDNIDIDSITYSFRNGKTIAKVYKNGEYLNSYSFKERLKIENLRESKKDNNQALVAVHESGHFVVYVNLKHKLPKTVRSVTTSSDKGGFVLHDIDDTIAYSSQDVLNEIKIALGGYVAECIIFGKEHVTNGSTTDLRQATSMASKYVRSYGMGEHIYNSTYLTSSIDTDGGNIINDDNRAVINNEIKSIIDKCLKEVTEMLNTKPWYDMLVESSKFLSVNSSLSTKKMKELYSIARNTKDLDSHDNFYKDIVSKL